jgi:hypothetical protein
MAVLAAEPFDFADGHAADADLKQGVAHFVQFERFDDGFNFLHTSFGPGGAFVGQMEIGIAFGAHFGQVQSAEFILAPGAQGNECGWTL